MIRTGVVGLGWWGRHIAGKLQGGSTKLQLTATADVDPTAGADVRDIDHLLDRPELDAVVLCLPHSLHEEAIVRCAEAGKHVFCEKPLTLTAASARRAIRACEEAGVVLGVGHERRFEEPMREVIRMFRDQALGTVLYAEAALSHDRFRDLPRDHWRGSSAEAPAAGMTGMGVHLTDLLISLFGPVREVQAFTERRVLSLPCGDVVSVHLYFEDGTIGTVSAVSATPFYGRLALFGSEAWLELSDDDHPEVGLGGTVTVCRRGGKPTARHIPNEGDAVLANLEAFADAVSGITPYPFSPAQLHHNVAVLEATTISAEQRVPVRMTGDLAWLGDRAD